VRYEADCGRFARIFSVRKRLFISHAIGHLSKI
jgi:hypothetical protein